MVMLAGPVPPVACHLVAVYPPMIFLSLPVVGRSPCYSLPLTILLKKRRNDPWRYGAAGRNMRAPFRLSCCSNGQNFLPTREPALGEPFLAHPPAARPSLDS